MNISQLIAAKVKEKRIEQGISRMKLANKVGITSRTIQNIENGSPCSVNTIQLLFDVLNIKVIIE